MIDKTQSQERVYNARKVTLVGMVVNILLTSGKLLAGVLGKSSAMLADGVHSLSDIATDFVVIAFVGIAGKEKDHDHQYGHGKYETFATMIISFALMLVGVGIFWDALQNILSAVDGKIMPKPGMVAFYAAIASIIAKEILYQYTILVGRRINSQTVIANAWHHRSDAFSSIGTALGIAGAIFLGEKWRVLDPVAGMIVSVFIMKVSWDLGMPSIRELLEVALPESIRVEIKNIIASQAGVIYHHQLRTRKIGNILAIEVHVKVDKGLTVEESHEIATAVENALRYKYGEQTHVGVHVEPYYLKNESKNESE
ncbi:MAG: cation-efflux pump [Bacteroidetes bacterium HGW-Bacteroidetes-1]|jgi:cation diffusion facilitator family transporter|nr:MAG: cation-efflux pump [Bacteroidetes bacterium HGW-Bacteroidetes-1]